MRTISVLLLTLFATAAFGAPKGALENPQPNDYASGIYLFSGWVCDAESVQIGLDGAQLLDVAYGTERPDTDAVCGDIDNGFGLLWNMALLPPGAHEAVLYADGQIVAQHTFNTAALSSGEFAEDLDGCAISEGFPMSDKDTIVRWTTSLQGFQIAEERERPLTENIDGYYFNQYWDASIWTFNTDCGEESVFLFAKVETDSNETDSIRMTGQVGKDRTLLSSTANSAVNREATLKIVSKSEIQIDFTACAPANAYSCYFIPAESTLTLKKMPNIMDTATKSVDP